MRRRIIISRQSTEGHGHLSADDQALDMPPPPCCAVPLAARVRPLTCKDIFSLWRDAIGGRELAVATESRACKAQSRGGPWPSQPQRNPRCAFVMQTTETDAEVYSTDNAHRRASFDVDSQFSVGFRGVCAERPRPFGGVLRQVCGWSRIASRRRFRGSHAPLCLAAWSFRDFLPDL